MHLKTRVNVVLSADRTNKLLLLSLRRGPEFKVLIKTRQLLREDKDLLLWSLNWRFITAVDSMPK